MPTFREFDHNFTYDPAVSIKRSFLLRLEVNPPKCLENYELEKVTEILDSDVPVEVNWLHFQGHEFLLILYKVVLSICRLYV